MPAKSTTYTAFARWTPLQLQAIGRFAVEFGHLESVTSGFAKQLAGLDEATAASLGLTKKTFGFWLPKFVKLAKPKLEGTPSYEKALSDFSTSAANVGEFRNKLLHHECHPFNNMFLEDGEPLEPFDPTESREVLHHAALGSILPDEILEKAAEAEALWKLAGRVMGTIIRQTQPEDRDGTA